MEPLNATDVAIGWSLILITAASLFFGVPYLLRVLLDRTSAALKQERQRRELIQEELDDQLREEMFAWAESQDWAAREQQERSREPD